MTGNALDQTTNQQRKTVTANFIQAMQPEIARALPRHMNGDRMARLALTAFRQTPKLANCTTESFAGALLTAATLGLEPNTPAGEAYLVPYEDRRKGIVECQLIVGYQGLVKLFWQSPLAQHIDAQAVYEKDDFDYGYGLDPFLRHKPAQGDRGAVVAYYAVAALTTGAKTFTVLAVEEVKQLRGGKVGTSGNIADPMHWMERKTALKQLIKTLPKSAELTAAVRADDIGSGSQLRQISTTERVNTQTGEITTAADEQPVDGA